MNTSNFKKKEPQKRGPKKNKCDKCGHEQFYKGGMNQYTCSSCGLKVKVLKGEKK